MSKSFNKIDKFENEKKITFKIKAKKLHTKNTRNKLKKNCSFKLSFL